MFRVNESAWREGETMGVEHRRTVGFGAGARLHSDTSRSRSQYRVGLSRLLLAFSLGSAGDAMASGYAIKEQSARLLGTAFAGAGSSGEDPSVMFFNPAGIARLDGYRFSGSASGIFPRTEFSNDGSTLTPLDLPIPGGDGGDAGEDALVPALYATAAPKDFLFFGLGVNAPFGLSIEYDDDWVGRYHAIESTLKTYNINPVVAVKPFSWLSLGAGLQIQYIDAKLTQAIDFGSILAGLGVPGAVPFGSDGEVHLKANDWGVGFTAGVLVEPIQGTRVGLSYRSFINQELDGDANFKGVPLPLQAVPNFQDQNASAEMSTPDSIDLSVYHELSDQWAVMADAKWTNWSRFDELRVDFDQAGVADSVTKESWHDSWFFALGAEYQPIEPLALRAGVAYDQTPVQDKHRTARLPDQDRYWLAIGGSYAVTRWLSADLGYAHIFVRDADINESVATGAIAHQLNGRYDAAVDIVSLQFNLKF
jgi:long-chain fatty acid transport protein